MIAIRAAFLPLTDCAVLVAAKECGFAKKHGIRLDLVREVSWATIRDRLIYRQVECAHMLAPLAVAVSLGLSQQAAPIAAPFKLSLNGNAIVVSSALAAQMGGTPATRIGQPARTAGLLAKAIRSLGRKPIIAIVHRFSSHALVLRYWLAYAGIDPERDIDLRVLPPPFMADALAAGEIDGFTAGEPWNSAAVALHAGEIVAFGCRIWESGPEKVLAMREDWTTANPEIVDRLVRALDEAAAWCDQSAHHPELARLLSASAYVGRAPELIERGLSGSIKLTGASEAFEEKNFLMFHRHAANFPWRSQALWIYSQLVRWGFVGHSKRAQLSASGVFRSDLYRRALAGGQTALPGASLKLEGAVDTLRGVASDKGTLMLGPDRFFDGRVFDPAQIGEYLTELGG